jgi:DNA-binding LacI/PurR family transcriptional regulator
MPDEFRSEISELLAPGILRYAWGKAEAACRLAPLLKKALAEKSITAWACANDMAALMALSFLKSRTIAVPGRISVVGFDNSLESMKAGLTTYDFNRSAAFYAALRYVISGTLPGSASGRRPLNISGYLVARATTRAMKA